MNPNPRRILRLQANNAFFFLPSSLMLGLFVSFQILIFYQYDYEFNLGSCDCLAKLIWRKPRQVKGDCTTPQSIGKVQPHIGGRNGQQHPLQFVKYLSFFFHRQCAVVGTALVVPSKTIWGTSIDELPFNTMPRPRSMVVRSTKAARLLTISASPTAPFSTSNWG